MAKRLVAALLWFLVGWCFYELAWSLLAFPRAVGPLFGTALAALVTLDPLAVFWPKSEGQRPQASLQVPIRAEE